MDVSPLVVWVFFVWILPAYLVLTIRRAAVKRRQLHRELGTFLERKRDTVQRPLVSRLLELTLVMPLLAFEQLTYVLAGDPEPARAFRDGQTLHSFGELLDEEFAKRRSVVIFAGAASISSWILLVYNLIVVFTNQPSVRGG